MHSRTLKFVLIWLCFFGSIIVTPVLAQIGGFPCGFGNVYEKQTVKQTIGIKITTNTGVYTYGCYSEKVGKLTISGPDAGDFKIEDDGVSGKTCGRGTTLRATIVFTPQGVGPRKAELNFSVTADHPQFQGDFSPKPIALQGTGIPIPINWGFFRTVTRLMAGTGAELAVPIMFWPSETERDEDYKDLNHYTDEKGHIGISSTGFIKTGTDGYVYLSPDNYISGKQAQQMLAMLNMPTGLFAIPEANIGGVYLPTVVEEKYGQPGGGLEILVPYKVLVRGAAWFPIGP